MMRPQIQDEAEVMFAQICRTVDQHGIAIPAIPEGDRLPPVAFTVGNAAQGLPDLILYGIAPDIAIPTIDLALSVVRETWPFPNFTRSEVVLQNFDVVFRDVSRSGLLERTMVLTAAFNRKRGHEQTPLLQICWPDVNGNFPYEASCEPGVARVQRIKDLRN